MWNAWFTVSSKGKQNLRGTNCITEKYWGGKKKSKTQNQPKQTRYVGSRTIHCLTETGLQLVTNFIFWFIAISCLNPWWKAVTCGVNPFIIYGIWLPFISQVGACLYLRAAFLHPSHLTGEFAKLILWVICGCYPSSFEMAIDCPFGFLDMALAPSLPLKEIQ